MEEAAADLVQRAVAADADQQVEAVPEQLAGDLRGLARLFGETELEFPEMPAQGRLDRFPAPAGPAAGGIGIDDDVDLVHRAFVSRRAQEPAGDQTGKRAGGDGQQQKQADGQGHHGLERAAGHGGGLTVGEERRHGPGRIDHRLQFFLGEPGDGHEAEDGEDAAAGKAAQGAGQQRVAAAQRRVRPVEQVDGQPGAQDDPGHEKQVEQVQAGENGKDARGAAAEKNAFAESL